MAKKEKTVNPVLHSLYLSLLEILGEDKARELFNRQEVDPEKLFKAEAATRPAVIFEKAGTALIEDFGEMAAQGLFIRAGRASLTFIRRFLPEMEELGSLENRLKSIEKRFFHSLLALAGLWSRETGLEAKVEMIDRLEFRWMMAFPPGKGSGILTPYFIFGLLEEFCTWLDARKSYRIVYSAPDEGHEAEISIAIHSQE